MKRFDEFYNTELTKTFNTYLPIQLDATCNGFQHLALLSDEVNLFSNLNLGEAKKDDDPQDFYTFILNKIKAHLQTLLLNLDDQGKDRDRIIRLLQLDLKRSNLKPLVMTKPYNASNYSLTNYLANSLVYRGYGELETYDNNTILKLVKEGKQAKIKLVDDVDRSSDSTYEDYTEFYKYVKDMEKKKKLSSNKNPQDCNLTSTKLGDPLKGTESPHKEYIYSSSETSSDFVSRSDLLYYVETFNTLLFQDFPHIKNLMEYLEKIAEILYNLNLPVL